MRTWSIEDVLVGAGPEAEGRASRSASRPPALRPGSFHDLQRLRETARRHVGRGVQGPLEVGPAVARYLRLCAILRQTPNPKPYTGKALKP